MSLVKNNSSYLTGFMFQQEVKQYDNQQCIQGAAKKNSLHKL